MQAKLHTPTITCITALFVLLGIGTPLAAAAETGLVGVELKAEAIARHEVGIQSRGMNADAQLMNRRDGYHIVRIVLSTTIDWSKQNQVILNDKSCTFTSDDGTPAIYHGTTDALGLISGGGGSFNRTARKPSRMKEGQTTTSARTHLFFWIPAKAKSLSLTYSGKNSTIDLPALTPPLLQTDASTWTMTGSSHVTEMPLWAGNRDWNHSFESGAGWQLLDMDITIDSAHAALLDEDAFRCYNWCLSLRNADGLRRTCHMHWMTGKADRPEIRGAISSYRDRTSGAIKNMKVTLAFPGTALKGDFTLHNLGRKIATVSIP